MFVAIYDTVWEELDRSLDDKRLVTCRRISVDPFSDKTSDRLGIKLGDDIILSFYYYLIIQWFFKFFEKIMIIDIVYQVLDVCSAHAGATSTTDALDVGLVCIRNLQVFIQFFFVCFFLIFFFIINILCFLGYRNRWAFYWKMVIWSSNLGRIS